MSLRTLCGVGKAGEICWSGRRERATEGESGARVGEGIGTRGGDFWS